MILHEFRCGAGHTSEDFVTSDTTAIRCKCGLEAHKVITPVRFKLEGVSGHFPTAHDKWARMHETEAAKSKDS